LELLPLLLELAILAAMTALSAKTKTLAINVLTEKFYKEKIASPLVTKASQLLTESALPAET
jgi:hypothetical protein